jgi:CAAX protease family protein
MDKPGAGIRWNTQQSLLAGIGLVLAFGFVLWKVIFPIPSSAPDGAVAGILVQWLTVLIVSFIAFKWLRLDRSELGLRGPRPLDWPIALGTFFVGMLAAGIVSSLFPAPESAKSAVAKLVNLPLPTRILLVITAGICEEFLFRGFAITALNRFIGNRWLSGLVSLAVFTVAHARLFGWNSALLIPCLLGLILTLLFLLRRNLIIGMAVHTLIDAIGLIVVPLAASKS